MSERPWLLMDVDGPLSPFRARWFERAVAPAPFCFHELATSSGQSFRVALNPEHGEELRELSQAYDLAWATTWQHDANRLIAPILGLSRDLPVVPLLRPRGWLQRRSWKTEQVCDWVGRRPFAWFDDEINRRTRAWARGAAWLSPHLFVRVAPEDGLGDQHFDALWDFVEGLDS